MNSRIFARRSTTAFAAGLFTLFAASPVQAEEKAADLAQELLERISISGAIEVEAAWSEDFDGESSSDISLATAEIALEGSLTDWAGATLALEWDEEEDKISIDEAFISLGSAELFPVQGQVGRFVVPFGVYDGNTIADPLTKEVFEAKEDALLAGFEINGFAGGIYLFNGDSSDGGGDDIEHFGLFAGYALETETMEIDFQLGYLSSVFDSDGLTDAFEAEADYVDGMAVQASLRFAGVVLLSEYVTALDDFRSAELGVTGLEPAAYHLEAGYNLELALPVYLGAAWSGSEDLGGIFPENRLAAVVGIELTEGLGLTFEYLRDYDYNEEDGGSGEEAEAVTVQLAYAF